MDAYIGEIRIMGFSFAPLYWAYCNGATMPISQNQALFAVIRNTYGGNYQQGTFALPNLQAQGTMGWGQGPGLSNHPFSQQVGANSVQLTPAQIPNHTHTATVALPKPPATRVAAPAAGAWLSNPVHTASSGQTSTIPAYSAITTPTTTLASQTVGTTGGNQAHENRQPFLAMNFCICLDGMFPSPN
jgi:microcystin-dependent protein